jgi:hypothetical protein
MQTILPEASHGSLTTFDARYIHTDLQHRDFLQVAGEDPGLREVYRDDQAVIFEVVTQ